jgi:hypothetical protein
LAVFCLRPPLIAWLIADVSAKKKMMKPSIEQPESRSHQKMRRWRVLAGGFFGICVSALLGWKLMTDSRGSTEARIAGWIIVPIVFAVCVRLVVLCFRKKEYDPFMRRSKSMRTEEAPNQSLPNAGDAQSADEALPPRG